MGHLARNVCVASVVAAAAVPSCTLFAAGASPDTMSVRLASFNIRTVKSSDTGPRAWKTRRASLCQMMDRVVSFDIIGLQEVSDSAHQWRYYLEGKMDDAGYAVNPRFQDCSFVGRTGGSGEECTIISRTNRFEVLCSNTFWHSATPSVRSRTRAWYLDEYNASASKSEYYRICTWALLRDRATGGVLCFADTHMDLYNGSRVEGARLVMRRLRAFTDAGIPVAVVGDFNHGDGELPYSIETECLQDAAFAAVQVSGPWRTYQGWGYVDPKSEASAEYVRTLPTSSQRAAAMGAGGGGKRIDYIEVSRDAAVKTYAVVSQPMDTDDPSSELYHAYPSDHYPIYADVDFPVVTSVAAWTGKGSDRRLSNPDNWAGRTAPREGDTLVFVPAADVEVNADMPGVRFASVISQGAGIVTFSGFLSADRITDDESRISVAAGATVEAGTLEHTGITSFMDRLAGSAAAGTLLLSGSATNKNSAAVAPAFTGSLRLEGIVHAGSGSGYSRFALVQSRQRSTLSLGGGGLSFCDNRAFFQNCKPYFFIPEGGVLDLRPTADFAFGENPCRDDGLCLYLTDGTGRLELSTSDADDASTPRTVTLEGGVGGYGSVSVSGCGVLAARSGLCVSGAVAVSDSATLALGVREGGYAGSFSISGSATLAIEGAAGRTVSIGGGLSLSGSAKLALENLPSDAAPVTAASLSVAGSPSVAILGAPPPDGVYTLVATETPLSGVLPDLAETEAVRGRTAALFAGVDDASGLSALKLALGDVRRGVWTGEGATAGWRDGGNWLDCSPPACPDVCVFERPAITGSRTAVIDGVLRTGPVTVDAGDESSPVAFVTPAVGGFANPSFPLCIGTESSGALRVSSGTHRFSALVLGGSAPGAGPGLLATEGADVSVGSLAVATNDSSVCSMSSDGGVLSVSDEIAVGAGNRACGVFAATNLTLEASGATLKIGGSEISQTSASGAVVKSGGDWTLGAVRLGSALDADATFVHDGGSMTVNGWVCVGYNNESAASSARLEISGGAVTNSAKSLGIADQGAPGSMAEVVIRDGGEYFSAGSIVVGQRSTAYLNIERGGRAAAAAGVVFCGQGATESAEFEPGEAAFLNLSGTLVTPSVRCSECAGEGTLTFDGGVLVADADGTLVRAAPNFTVRATASGGVIDTAGHTVEVAERIEDVAGEAGCLALAGGGSVSLSAGSDCTGVTTVEADTALRTGAGGTVFAGRVVFSEGARLAVDSVKGWFTAVRADDIVIAGPLAVDVPRCDSAMPLPILTKTGSGVFTEEDLDKIEFAEPFEDVLVLSDDRRSICIGSAYPYTWTGAADGNLLNPDNWLGGEVPDGTNAVIGVSEPATLVCTGPFTPSAITFTPWSKKVAVETADGGTISGLVAVTNRASGVHHEFRAPVAFDPAVTAYVSLVRNYYMSFPGGLIASGIITGSGYIYCGDVTLTTEAPFAFGKNAVVTNGTFSVANYLGSASGDGVVVARTGTLRCSTASMPASASEPYLVQGLYGTVEITDVLNASASYKFRFVANGSAGHELGSDGVLYVARLSGDSDGRIKYIAPNIRYCIGDGGMSGSDWMPWRDWNPMIGAYSDYTISGTVTCFSSGMNNITFDTTDMRDPDTGRSVTLVADGEIYGARLSVSVAGKGEFVFAGGSMDIGGAFSVADGAKVVFVSKDGRVESAAVGSLSCEGSAALEIRGDPLGEGRHPLFECRNGIGRLPRLSGAGPLQGEQTALVFDGDWLYLRIGASVFEEGEAVALAGGAPHVLAGHEARWLNMLGSRDETEEMIAEIAPDEFIAAGLLNLDIREDGWRNWTFDIVAATAEPGDGVRNVTVAVRLVREKPMRHDGADAPINGEVALFVLDPDGGGTFSRLGNPADDPVFENGGTALFGFETPEVSSLYRAVVLPR